MAKQLHTSLKYGAHAIWACIVFAAILCVAFALLFSEHIGLWWSIRSEKFGAVKVVPLHEAIDALRAERIAMGPQRLYLPMEQIDQLTLFRSQDACAIRMSNGIEVLFQEGNTNNSSTGPTTPHVARLYQCSPSDFSFALKRSEVQELKNCLLSKKALCRPEVHSIAFTRGSDWMAIVLIDNRKWEFEWETTDGRRGGTVIVGRFDRECDKSDLLMCRQIVASITIDSNRTTKTAADWESFATMLKGRGVRIVEE